MRLRPIDDGCLQEAAAILSRGFPERSASFWDTALRRLSSYRKATAVAPIGQMMIVDDKPVGVILTIASGREYGNDRREVVNLSSWFVETKYRWLAPRMLQQVVSKASATYTDLSPSAETSKINERLGFRVVSRGVLMFILPWLAMTRRAPGLVIPLDQVPAAALTAGERSMLVQHEGLGCVAAALHLNGYYHPLLFHVTRRQGLPVARVLWADSRHLARNIAAIARFLLRRGILLLTAHADRDEHMSVGLMWKRSAPVQVKGTWQRGHIDHTFSERVFLQL